MREGNKNVIYITQYVHKGNVLDIDHRNTYGHDPNGLMFIVLMILTFNIIYNFKLNLVVKS